MKTHRFLTLFALVLLAAPLAFAADFGVRAGRFNDSDADFVGAELDIDLGSFHLNPNLEYQLEDDVTAGTANLDLLYDIGTFGRITPYVGAGVGMLYIAPEGGSSETDLLGNLIGGVAFDLDFLEPYAQLKYFRVIEDDEGGEADDFAIVVGLRF